MAITYTIPGIPLIDQRSEPTVDGQPNENARKNCVFDANAAYATAVLHRRVYGDELKDEDNNYGQGYVGFASEKNLIDTMGRLGISVTRHTSSTQQGLVDIIHQEVPKGHGVIVTIPSRWNSAVEDAGKSWNPRTYDGYSHVVLACGVGPNEIRCANSWGGFWHDGDDAYWKLRLLEGEVWVLAYTGEAKMATVPSGWKDDGKTLVAPNGVPVIRGFRDFVLGYPGGWEHDNYPERAEAHMESVEPGNTSIGAGVRQDFRWRSLGWTQSRGAYVIWVGHDIIALENQLEAANKHIAQMEQQLADAQKQLAPTPAPDPKATEALTALAELAKALKLVGEAAA